MRIAHLLRKYDPAEWGGTETAVQRMLAGLRDDGVESVVYCPRLKEPPQTDPLQKEGHLIRRFRAFVPVLGITPQLKRQLIAIGGNLMSFDLIPLLHHEKGLSIIHTHTLGRIGAIGRTIARRRNLPLVITIHGGVLDLPPEMKTKFNTPVAGGWEWGRFFGLIFQSHSLFRDADAIIACNKNEEKLLREKHPGKRVLVQHHGVPLALYQQDQRDCALKAHPQIAGKQLLLCVGRIDPVKNQAWLLDRAPEIFKKYPDALIAFAGACTDRDYGELIRRKIQNLGLNGRVLIAGGLPPNDPRLIGLFQQASIVVVPSIAETFGLVILEAWAAETQVLSSRTSGACSLVRNGQNGWLFDLENPAAFLQTLDLALGRPDVARKVLRGGNDEVRKEYDVGVLAGQMKKLYAELIEEKNALRHSS